eukprot:210418-Prymnesium_polylepis.2
MALASSGRLPLPLPANTAGVSPAAAAALGAGDARKKAAIPPVFLAEAGAAALASRGRFGGAAVFLTPGTGGGRARSTASATPAASAALDELAAAPCGVPPPSLGGRTPTFAAASLAFRADVSVAALARAARCAAKRALPVGAPPGRSTHALMSTSLAAAAAAAAASAASSAAASSVCTAR